MAQRLLFHDSPVLHSLLELFEVSENELLLLLDLKNFDDLEVVESVRNWFAFQDRKLEKKVQATILLGDVLDVSWRVEDRDLSEHENDHNAIQYLQQ